MTVLTEGVDKLYLSTPAQILDFNRDTASAWASKYVTEDPAKKWIVANYVEADNANSNGQYWTYEDLKMSQPTISYTPMNIDHRPHNIVGSWVASEMVYPTTADSAINTYIETLGVFWRYYFPDQMEKVQEAYDAGQLWVSMECVAESVTCSGDNGCGASFAYEGPVSDKYCAHINERASYRVLNNPSFLAGGLIMPGNRPGWKNADVKEISKFTTDEQKESIIRDIAKTQPEASAEQWENVMWALQMQALEQKVNFFTK